MTMRTGFPKWSWPEWRTAKPGTRVEHVLSGRRATYHGPARARHNGAIVRWDTTPATERGIDGRGGSYVVSPARDLRPVPEV